MKAFLIGASAIVFGQLILAVMEGALGAPVSSVFSLVLGYTIGVSVQTYIAWDVIKRNFK